MGIINRWAHIGLMYICIPGPWYLVDYQVQLQQLYAAATTALRCYSSFQYAAIFTLTLLKYCRSYTI